MNDGTLHGWMMLLPESGCGLLDRNSSLWYESLLMSDWSRDPKALKTIQTIATALACPLELDGDNPPLKTPHALVERHREIKVEQTWKLPLIEDKGKNTRMYHWPEYQKASRTMQTWPAPWVSILVVYNPRSNKPD